MNGGVDFWLGQLLSLLFYLMTIIVYNRAKREYVGGKIAAALNLIMICLAILLLTDFVDYFLLKLLPLERDIVTILKILLKLIAICVLFFGGLKFFSSRSISHEMDVDTDILSGIETDFSQPSVSDETVDNRSTVIIEELAEKKKPKLGRYEILEQIGKGAMGIVYKGRDPKLNRLTAIKTIRFIDEFDEDKAELVKAQFYREAEVVARLSHKNIVMMYDVGEDLDLSYLAMEYLEGESLENYTSPENLLPLDQCLSYIIQVCEALNYAHEQGIIHRDIKPGNIMILEGGLVKVMDFGIARAAGGTKTRTGIIKGTPFYMSPEQAKGAHLTGASDIFSVGVLFYQLLTGKLPFSGENLATIMYQTANVSPEPVNSYRQDLDQAIVAALNQAIEKKPEERFNNALAMADALRRALNAMGQEISSGETLKERLVLPHEPALDTAPGTTPEDTIDMSDLKQVLQTDATEQVADGTKSDGAEGSQPTDSDGQMGLATEDFETKTGFDLAELREMLAAGRKRMATEDAPPEQESDAELDAFKQVQAIEADTGRQMGPAEPVVAPVLDEAGIPQKTSPRFQEDRKTLPGYAFPVAYAVLALILFSWCYYFFWKSPNADNRLAKLVYYKYFESAEQKNKKMQAEQERLVQELMKQKLAEKQELAKIEAQKKVEQEKLETVQEEKTNEQMALAMQKIEEEKKLEAERQVRLEQEKKLAAEKERQEVENKRKEAERQARIAAEQKRLKERLEKEKREAEISNELANVTTFLNKADSYREKKEYSAALKQYTAALDIIDKSQHHLDPRMDQQKSEIKSTLLEDDMVYGPKGFVEYKGTWLSKQNYEATLYKEGFVKYKNEFRDYKTLRKLIRAKTEPLVDSFVMAKYSDGVIHKKDIKYRQIKLKRNDNHTSVYLVDYSWEVWRFKGIEDGSCTVEIAYEVGQDQWNLIKGCKE